MGAFLYVLVLISHIEIPRIILVIFTIAIFEQMFYVTVTTCENLIKKEKQFGK